MQTTLTHQTVSSDAVRKNPKKMRSQQQRGGIPPRSAFFGLRLAVPLALAMWALLVGLIWFFTH